MEAAMSGRSPKQKGTRLERLVVAQFRSAGIEAKRVPLSGSADGFKGDIAVTLNGHDLTLEVKSRKQCSLYRWLGERDALIVKADRQVPLIAMRLGEMLQLLGDHDEKA